jgi:hypothetical protein
VGLGNKLEAAVAARANRLGRAYRDPELDQLTVKALEIVLPLAEGLGRDPWTNEANDWRCAGWPSRTVGRYSEMVGQWLDEIVPHFLGTLEYRPEGPSWNASARLAANRLRGAGFRHLPAYQRNNAWRVSLALDEYGHPFACEDAQMGLWCAGMCDADWRQSRYRMLPGGKWSRSRPGDLRMFPHIPWMQTAI